jgi:hypothetical protein
MRRFSDAERSVTVYSYGDRICNLRESFQALREKNKREARGQRLLKEWLSPAQLVQYTANDHFDVTGSDSGKRYRIRYGTAVNIHEVDGAGHAKIGLCFVPEGHLVSGDVMLAQKIALETDECAALLVAKTFGPNDSRSNIFLHY